MIRARAEMLGEDELASFVESGPWNTTPDAWQATPPAARAEWLEQALASWLEQAQPGPSAGAATMGRR